MSEPNSSKLGRQIDRYLVELHERKRGGMKRREIKRQQEIGRNENIRMSLTSTKVCRASRISSRLLCLYVWLILVKHAAYYRYLSMSQLSSLVSQKSRKTERPSWFVHLSGGSSCEGGVRGGPLQFNHQSTCLTSNQTSCLIARKLLAFAQSCNSSR